MSEGNEAIVRATAEALRRPEVVERFASGEIDMSWVDPDVEWDASRLTELIPDLAEVFRGHDGVRTYWGRWLEAWRDLSYEIEDVRSSGDDVALLIRNQHQSGRHTGIETELPPYGMVFTFRDGLLVRWRTFPSQAEALEAAGIAP